MTRSPLLDAYLSRVGFDGAVAADTVTLDRLHLAHLSAIPFENLDIQMGRPIRLDPASLEAKLIRGGRGGYCFEQNTLLQQMLTEVGFETMPCEARVRPAGSTSITPRTHMVLVVTLAGRRFLCDVGFGGDGPLLPVPLDGTPTEQFGNRYRLASEGPLLVLQRQSAATWVDSYAFVPERRHPIDFEMANWYTSTHPSSRFVTTLTAQRALPEARHVLRNLTYTVTDRGGVNTREVQRRDLIPLLGDVFGIRLPADTRFAALDGLRPPDP